jgi:hypothetical protein
MKSKVKYRKKRTRGRHLALPELLPGLRGRANWHVGALDGMHTPGTINQLGGDSKMWLPEGSEPLDRFIRLHEMLHAAHSPIEPPQPVPRSEGPPISTGAIIIAEEIRINSILRYKVGTDFMDQCRAASHEMAAKYMDRMEAAPLGPDLLLDLLQYHLALWAQDGMELSSGTTYVTNRIVAIRNKFEAGSPERMFWDSALQYVRTTAQNIWKDCSEGFEDLARGDIPGWDWTLKMANYIDAVQNHAKATQQLVQSAAQQAKGFDEDEADLEIVGQWNRKTTDEQLNQALDGLLKPESVEQDPGGKKAEGKTELDLESWRRTDGRGESLEWGEMEIIEPPRKLKLPGKKRRSQKYRATDAGAVPRYVHRMLIDQQPFARKRMEPAGGVLIDDSGSMGFTMKQISDIVQAAPAVAIAAYSGRGHKGELVIIAKDGTWQDQVRPDGGGNDVDYPALEWLAEQPEPRIWVTDGGVIPISGSYVDASEQCIEFARKNKINIVENVEEAREVFLGQRALYR